MERFYLYNNSSSDNYLEILFPYIKKKIVYLTDWPTENFACFGVAQCNAYDDAVKKSIGKVKWLAAIDTDEFLFPVKCKNLVQFLKDYEDFGGLCVNWQMYGTAFVSNIPKGSLLIETLSRKAPLNYSGNKHVKSIVRPERVAYFPCAHYAAYTPKFFQVNADKEPFSGPFSPYIAIDKIRINHYWSRDEDFFKKVKIGRRNEFGDNEHNSMNQLNHLNAEEDTEKSIFRFVDKLRKKCFN